MILFNSHEVTGPVKATMSVVRKRPDYITAMALWVSCFLLLGLAVATAYSADDATDWNNRAVGLSKAGKYEEAIAAFDKAISLGLKREDEGMAWTLKGLSLTKLGRHEEAIKAYDKAISLGIRKDLEAYAWYEKGSSLASLGRNEEALKAFDRAINLGLQKRDEAYAWYSSGTSLRI